MPKKIDKGNSGFAGDIVSQVAKAWQAISGKWDTAREEFKIASSDFERFGGSRAQRDLFEFAYVNVLMHSGKKQLRENFVRATTSFYETAPIKNIAL